MLLCSTPLGSFLTEMSIFSQLQPTLLLLCFSGVNGKLAEMLQSLVKSCYFCPALLREFASRGDQNFSVPIHYKVSYHSSEISSTKTHSRNLFGREESRRGAVSAKAESN